MKAKDRPSRTPSSCVPILKVFYFCFPEIQNEEYQKMKLRSSFRGFTPRAKWLVVDGHRSPSWAAATCRPCRAGPAKGRPPRTSGANPSKQLGLASHQSRKCQESFPSGGEARFSWAHLSAGWLRQHDVFDNCSRPFSQIFLSLPEHSDYWRV